MNFLRRVFLTVPLVACLAVSSSRGQVVIDGLLGATEFGPASATQAIGTGFGDNDSELNQAFVDNNAGTLSVLTTGNLATNGNRFVTLIDIVDDASGAPTIPAAASGGVSATNQNLIAGSTFDNAPEFAVFVTESAGGFVASLQNLTTGTDVTSVSLTGDPNTGTTQGAGGPVGGGLLSVAWTNANTAGVGAGGGGEADPNAASAVSGIEFALDKSLIGSPTGDLRIASFVVASTGFFSNQFLGPLPEGFANLGVGPVDLTTIPGDQFYTPFRETITLRSGDAPLPAGTVVADNTQVNLYAGGVLESGFPAFSSTALGAQRLEINVLGGSIGDFFVAQSGSKVTIFDGSLGDAFTAGAGSVVTIAGGVVGDAFASAGSQVTISGGVIGDAFTAGDGSEVTIVGGQIGPDFFAEAGSTINLGGSQFAYNAGVIPGLPAGVAFFVEDRGDALTLSGLLEDGGAFSLDLSPFGAGAADDVVSPNATLTITPNADQGLAGDYNGNGDVSAPDYTVFRDRYTRTPALYDTFAANFGAAATSPLVSAAPVPEPSAALLGMLAAAGAAGLRPR